jgi:hypothetical protein
VARGKATFATLAHVVVSKFDHHLPLYRQAEMMAAQGSRSTARRSRAGPGKLQHCSTRWSAVSVTRCSRPTRSTPTTRRCRCSTPAVARPRPGGCGCTPPTTKRPAARHRPQHGIASRPTAPRRTHRRISPAFAAFSRPMPMRAMTPCTAVASQRWHAGHTSGARCSTCTSASPRR